MVKKSNTECKAFLVQNISNYQDRYISFIQGLKKDNFTIIGYAYKSPNDLTNDALNTLLNKMIHCLRSRSLVDQVYISPKS
ncbi:hypothetical protein BDB00DRAFT_775155 [Zychaea mexicana]|uniref:uncharacterized protein n=1 Tax=Zychaea mexicana TaxID=64656 RepID=UPI0022FECDBF|nr:uncharacterized protein BDB00DRAFT_775155 [Zychaea mexicana]KAI9484296.1 hypothetical protein BDB00DRAFT_775155 [Zychaea mexicana]